LSHTRTPNGYLPDGYAGDGYPLPSLLPSGRLSSDGYNHGLTKILMRCRRDALNNMEDQFMHAHEENQRIDQDAQEPLAITLCRRPPPISTQSLSTHSFVDVKLIGSGEAAAGRSKSCYADRVHARCRGCGPRSSAMQSCPENKVYMRNFLSHSNAQICLLVLYTR
jgi:hypothetical protein